MDKRREPRFATDQLVSITALGDQRFGQIAKVRNSSGSGLGLLVETQIAAGTALRIEWEDAILLGEVMYSRRVENGHFVGVQLEQVLCGLRELRRSVRGFTGETEEDPVETR
jgi:hypothetical protein